MATPTPVTGAPSAFDLALPEIADGVEGRLFVARVCSKVGQEARSLASGPLRFVSSRILGDVPEDPRLEFDVRDGDRAGIEDGRPRLSTTAKEAGVLVYEGQIPATAVKLFEVRDPTDDRELDRTSRVVSPVIVLTKQQPKQPGIPPVWTGNVAVDGAGTHHYRAVLYQSDIRFASTPAVTIRFQEPTTLKEIKPARFGLPGDADVLILQFEGGPLRRDAAESRANYILRPIADFNTQGFARPVHRIGASYDPKLKQVILIFPDGLLRSMSYRLQFEPGLIGGDGEPIPSPDEDKAVIRSPFEVPIKRLRPFSRRPTIVRLLRRDETDESVDGIEEQLVDIFLESPPGSTGPDALPTTSWTFDRPARFTLMEFGIHGHDYESDGAVIYEGMRLVVAPDGQYQVRFIASTPAMPVTFQLRVMTRSKYGPSPIQLTLPPIVVPPYTNPNGDYEAAEWLVVHSGHSSALARAYPSILWDRTTRDGTARFGSLPPRDQLRLIR